MTDQTPRGGRTSASGSEPDRRALERVLAALTPTLRATREQVARGEAELAKYRRVELITHLALIILDYPDVESLGYQPERTYVEEDAEQPAWALHAQIAMRADTSDPAGEAQAEHEFDNLLADHDPATVAEVFTAPLGQPAHIPAGRLRAPAAEIATAWREQPTI